MIKKLTKDISEILNYKVDLTVTDKGINIYKKHMFHGISLDLNFYRNGKVLFYKADLKAMELKQIMLLIDIFFQDFYKEKSWYRNIR